MQNFDRRSLKGFALIAFLLGQYQIVSSDFFEKDFIFPSTWEHISQNDLSFDHLNLLKNSSINTTGINSLNLEANFNEVMVRPTSQIALRKEPYQNKAYFDPEETSGFVAPKIITQSSASEQTYKNSPSSSTASSDDIAEDDAEWAAFLEELFQDESFDFDSLY